MTDIVERARLVQRVNAHWLDSICDCDECTEERFDLITPMADEIEALRARVKELEAERERDWYKGLHDDHCAMSCDDTPPWKRATDSASVPLYTYRGRRSGLIDGKFTAEQVRQMARKEGYSEEAIKRMLATADQPTVSIEK